ncbi:MAG: esterase/lipase family protein [Oceanococcus sp.]
MDNTLETDRRPSGLQPQDITRLRIYLSRGLGLSHVAFGLAGEIVNVVERMHGTISRAPLPWQTLKRDKALGIAGVVYRIIRQSFDHLSGGFAEASRALDDKTAMSDGSWLKFQSALNGVCGDLLAQQQSPIALDMRLVSRGDTSPSSGQHQVIFLHGLCMSELGWINAAHDRFCQQLESHQQASVHYLRYNSGLRISENGRKLSALLDNMANSNRPISLIGHSMGGLLIRSALHAAQAEGHRWPQNVYLAAFLGSPHHGAPLERVGNHANRLLKTTAYSTPLAHLGDLRSAGIQDLRHGNVCEQDWQALPRPDEPSDRRNHAPLLAGPKYLLLAATLSENIVGDPINAKHDYLVPVASALGLSVNPEHQLRAPALQRHVVTDINHLDLLSHEQVYHHLAASMQR